MGPDCTFQGRAVAGGRVPNPGYPSTPGRSGKGDARPGPPPPPKTQQQQTDERTPAGYAEGHEPLGTARLAPCEGTSGSARAKTQREARSCEHCKSASTQPSETHAAHTRRAPEPCTRNAQTTWNGVPAGEGKGHPDRPTCYKHREGCEQGTSREGGGKKKRPRPLPPDLLQPQHKHQHSIAPAEAVVAQDVTHQPRGYAASAPIHGVPLATSQ